jgi:hypothetical protein
VYTGCDILVTYTIDGKVESKSESAFKNGRWLDVRLLPQIIEDEEEPRSCVYRSFWVLNLIKDKLYVDLHDHIKIVEKEESGKRSVDEWYVPFHKWCTVREFERDMGDRYGVVMKFTYYRTRSGSFGEYDEKIVNNGDDEELLNMRVDIFNRVVVRVDLAKIISARDDTIRELVQREAAALDKVRKLEIDLCQICAVIESD